MPFCSACRAVTIKEVSFREDTWVSSPSVLALFFCLCRDIWSASKSCHVSATLRGALLDFTIFADVVPQRPARIRKTLAWHLHSWYLAASLLQTEAFPSARPRLTPVSERIHSGKCPKTCCPRRRPADSCLRLVSFPVFLFLFFCTLLGWR